MIDREEPAATKLRDRWLGRISREVDAHKNWRDKAKESRDAFDPKEKQPAFPIYWSIINIIKAAIFAKAPVPDVRKRWAENQGGDKQAQIVERSLVYDMDVEDFDGEANLAVEDYLVEALGVSKVELETVTEERPVFDPTDPTVVLDINGAPLEQGPDGKPLVAPATQKVIAKQGVRHVHFSARDFHWEPQKSWKRVGWVGFDHHMSRADIKAQFRVKLKASTTAGEGGDSDKAASQKYEVREVVHEVWDLKAKKRLFVSECHHDVLEEGPLPMDLASRFPCPRPMMTNVASNDLLPRPDYQKIKGQCDSIDTLTGRIRALVKQLKDIGFYDAQLGELGDLQDLEDGQLKPVESLLERLGQAPGVKAGFDSVVAKEDLSNKVSVIRELIVQRESEKNALFETLGIADIIRGASDPRETMGAQQLKGQWANVRIGPKMREVARYFRDLARIQAEVTGKYVQREQLEKRTGMAISDQEYKQLQSELGTAYVVDIETDSTLAQDASQDKADTLELLKVLSDYMARWLPMVSAGQLPASFVKELLLMAARPYKNGRQLVDELNSLPDDAQQLQQFQQQVQKLTQDLQACQKQLQEAQGQLGQVNARDEQRKDVATASRSNLEGAQADERRADAQETAVRTMQAATQPQVVVPIR